MFTGDLNVNSELEEALRLNAQDLNHKNPSLKDDKIAAKARYREGERLDRVKFIKPLNKRQWRVVQQFYSGELLNSRNETIWRSGHGRLMTHSGQTMDIGGNTGGASRRIIDGRTPPDCRDFFRRAYNTFQ